MPLEPEVFAGTSSIHSTLPMDDAEFREIVVEFVGRLDGRLDEMQQLCKQRKYAQLAIQAHWLKGSGATVGYAPLGHAAAALERAAKLPSATEVDRLMSVIMNVRSRMVVPLAN